MNVERKEEGCRCKGAADAGNRSVEEQKNKKGAAEVDGQTCVIAKRWAALR